MPVAENTSMTKATLVFDLDGTIVHSSPDIANALNHVLSNLGGAPLSIAEVQLMIGNGMPSLLERGLAARKITLSKSEFQQQFEVLRDFYMANWFVDSTLFPGAVEMLVRVRKAGYLTAICTNKLETITLMMLDKLGLAQYFDGVVGAEPPRPSKPYAAPVILAIARAGGQTTNSIMIGDSPADIGAGKAAGLPTIAVSFGYTNVAPAQLGADLLIDHLSEVLDAVHKIEAAAQAQA